MNKHKLIAITLLSFFLSTTGVFAREMDRNELGKEALKLKPDTNYIYVIGHYAFTSTYKLKQEDIMFASRSIEANEDISREELYKKMNIQLVEPTYDSKFNVTGWKNGKNAVGSVQLGEKFDIRYIDYTHYAEKSNLKLQQNLAENEAYQQLLNSNNLGFTPEEAYGEEGLTISSDGKVSGLLLKNEELKLSAEDKAKYDTPYFFAYALDIPNATDKTTVKVSGMGIDGTIDWEDFGIKVDSATAKIANYRTNLIATKATSDFSKVVLVPVDIDDWKANSRITITVDLDGSLDEYEATSYTLDLSGLRFQTASKGELTDADTDVSSENKATLTSWGYTIPTGENKHYKLEKQEDGTYSLTGKIELQHTNAKVFAENGEDGYYFLFNLKKPTELKSVPDSVKVTVTGKETKTFGKEYFDANGVYSNLFKLDNQCKDETCKIEITVDWDGDSGKEYLPSEKITINYSGLKFVKSSKSNIIAADESATKALNESYGWTKPSDLNAEFNTEGTTVKVSKFLPIVELTSEKAPFDEEGKTGYYLPFTITTETDKTNDTTVQIIDGEETKTLTATNFDENKKLYMLKHLHNNDSDKKFTVVVDMDGEAGDEYAPYTLTVDWSELTLQEKTTASINVVSSSTCDIPKSDKDKIISWGYKFPDDITLSSDNTEHNKGNLVYNAETETLSGTIKEQILTDGFETKDLDSYFYTFTIKPEVVTEDVKVVITTGDSITKTFDYDDFDEDKKVLTILQHISKEDKSSPKDLKIKIDSDGDDKKNYLESKEYNIKYDDDNIDLVDLHTVTYKTDKETKSYVYDGEKLVKPANPTKAKDDKDDHQYNTFGHWNIDDETADSEFKFDEQNKSETQITKDITLYPIWEIDVNQYITDAISHINGKESAKDTFKFVSESENKLVLDILNKTKKISEITDTAIASTIAHALASGEIDNIKVSLDSNEQEFTNSSNKSESEIKTQVESELKNFLDTVTTGNNGDKTLDDLYQKWHAVDNGLAITITPKKDVAKLLGSDAESVTYNVGITEDLAIEFDAGSLTNPETQYVRTGDDIASLPTIEIPEKEKAYRTFDGWYDESNKVESLTDIHTDKKLIAHYTLNVDKFVEDVISDLNSDNTTYSNNFNNKFHLTQDTDNNNNIKINADAPNINLTELANTSIPGAIAYVLQKDEIEDITLTVGAHSKQYTIGYTDDSDKQFTDSSNRDLLDATGKTLKAEIVKSAKDAFDAELENQEENTTLDQLAYAKKSFSIKIGNKIDSIKLVNSDETEISSDEDKTYNFTFNSDFVVVDQDDDLGVKDINTALSSDYNTIYIDGDYNLSDTLSIEKDVTINSIGDSESLVKLTAENKKYVVDVKSGTVTIKNLKLTGGTKSQLKVESGTVTVDNIDVSGIETEEFTTDEKEYNAGIIISGGTLNASNVKNDSENYDVPTIRVLRDSKEEIKNIVTSKNMSSNDRYYPIARKHATNDEHGVLYDKCYYKDGHHAKFYTITFHDPIDRDKSGAAISLVKFYHHGDKISNSEIQEFRTSLEEKHKEEMDQYEFEGWHITETNGDEKLGTIPTKRKVENFDNETLTGDAKYYAAYKKKPSAAISYQSANGLTEQNGEISGTLTEQNGDGKYIIPVTLTFADNKFNNNTTVNVIDPNNNSTSYSFNGSQTISLPLEAIKSSKITGERGKLYTINLDVDGEEETYEPETYEIDYSDVTTLEEKINTASKNTQDANSLTITKDNKIKGGVENFTFKYDKAKDLTLYNDGKDDVEYTFKYNTVDTSHKGPIIIQVRKAKEQSECKNGVCRAKINDWEFGNFFTKVSKGYHEISLLQDVMKQTTADDINAIKKVQPVDGEEHTYNVTLNKDKLNNWLNNAYMSETVYGKEDQTQEKQEDGTTENNNVVLKVVLDAEEKYLVSMETTQNFSVTATSGTQYNDNKINVKFDNVNKTEIKSPIEFLSKSDKQLTVDDFKKFYEDCKKWHKATTGAEIYEG